MCGCCWEATGVALVSLQVCSIRFLFRWIFSAMGCDVLQIIEIVGAN